MSDIYMANKQTNKQQPNLIWSKPVESNSLSTQTTNKQQTRHEIEIKIFFNLNLFDCFHPTSSLVIQSYLLFNANFSIYRCFSFVRSFIYISAILLYFSEYQILNWWNVWFLFFSSIYLLSFFCFSIWKRKIFSRLLSSSILLEAFIYTLLLFLINVIRYERKEKSTNAFFQMPTI